MMRRAVGCLLGFFAVFAVCLTPALAEELVFNAQADTPTILDGVQLEPGQYLLKVNKKGEAKLYRGRKLIMTSTVEYLPLKNSDVPGSVFRDSNGQLEVNLKAGKVVFKGCVWKSS